MKIATRRSKLAQVQTETVMGMIKNKFNIDCEKLLIETIGDKILDVTLDKIGGKGLFVKEIEMALYDKNADIAVHSMKDVPFELPAGFEIVAIPKREDVRDVFVSMNGCKFEDLKKGAKIGTSSNRRAAQLKILRPDLEIVPVRGNVQTRIAKIETENLDGIILAAAGLKRLGMESIITNYFDPQEFVPAVGQGALGIETLSDYDNKDMLLHMQDEETRVCVEAERSFMRALGGDCHSTIGAYARIDGESMKMVGLFEVNGETVKKDIEGKKEDYIKLGRELAKKIIG